MLDRTQQRIVGVLVEKELSVPDSYPMTENALIAACNQKQNRDPVMCFDSDTVWNALESLRERGLITVVLPAPGARTKRYRHDVDTQLGWQRRERAIMAELLLRGPQTPGELRSRCSRFVPFDDLEPITFGNDHAVPFCFGHLCLLYPSASERAQPRDRLTKDKRVNIVRSLIGVHALEVGEVPHGLVLGQNAIRAEQPTRLTGALTCHVHVVALCQGHLGRGKGPPILESPQLYTQELRFGDLGEHLGKARLLDLEPADGAVKHDALRRVRACLLEASHGCPNASPRNPVPCLVQAHDRTPETTTSGEDMVFGDPHIL